MIFYSIKVFKLIYFLLNEWKFFNIFITTVTQFTFYLDWIGIFFYMLETFLF